MTETEREEIALFRYTVIRPLLDRDLGRAERRALLEAILATHHDIPGTNRTRLSRRTVERWCQAYRERGFEGLKPRPRHDAGTYRRLSQEVRTAAKVRMEELPTRSVNQVIAILEATGVATPGEVKRRTLSRFLADQGLSRRHFRTRRLGVDRRFEVQQPNDLWQMDFTPGLYALDEHGQRQRTSLVAILDDHSRLVPFAAFRFHEDILTVEDAVRRAILRYGVPARLYTDNGQVFQSRVLKLAAAELGIHLTKTPPYRPEGRGKLERWFATVQQAFYPEAKLAGPLPLDELNQLFWAWLEEAYHHRPHSETGQTPAARFVAASVPIRTVDPETLSSAFLWQAERRVQKTATVSLDGLTYQVDPQLVGCRIVLRYDPHERSAVRVYYRGRRYADAPLVQGLPNPTLPPPADPASQQGAPTYLFALQAKHNDRIRRELGGIRFANHYRQGGNRDV